MKLKNLLVLAVPAFFWAACSSDSESTPAQPPVPTEISSASTVDPSVPAEPSDPANPAIPGIESSASVDGVPLSSDAGTDPTDPGVPFVAEELVYDTIGFADIGNAFRDGMQVDGIIIDLGDIA